MSMKLERQIEGIDVKIQVVEAKIERVEAKIERVEEETEKVDEKLTWIEASITKRNARRVQDSLKHHQQVKVQLGQKNGHLQIEKQALMDKERDLRREKMDLQQRLGLSARQLAGQSAGGTVDAVKIAAAVVKELKSPLKSIQEMNALLLSLHFNPTQSHSSSIKGKDYRKKALEKYGIDEDATHMQCMAMGDLGGQVPMKSIKASHIFQKQWPARLLQRLSIDINDPANLLLLHSAVEKRLDRFDITIVPEDERYVIKVLNPGILDETAQSHEGSSVVFWHQLQNKELNFTSSHRPAKRLCAFHARMASSHAVSSGWIKKGEVLIPQEAWGSPGFDNKWLLQRFLDEQLGTSSEDSPLKPKSLNEGFEFMVSVLAFPLFSKFFILHFYHPY